ncbi:MAG TPA: DUF4112 domain-containing protein [Longimicrobiales bacterium]|nr:DUF4112 domain-containing protein [Longimicrobiales bacterium]
MLPLQLMVNSGTDGLHRIAWLLDDLVRVPGTSRRFGLDPVLGLLPGGGDIAGGALSAYIVLAAARLGAPSSVILRMGWNIVVDTVLGAVPLLGDLFDAWWKANRRNVALLESYMEQPGSARRSSRFVLAGVLVGIAATVIGMAVLTVLAVRWVVGLL